MKHNGAEITIKLLERQGIRVIAGIPGGSNLPLYHALYHSRIRHILTRHEQAAGFIAQGIARATLKPAVCFATSGPGATNLLTAIADAKLDSIPLIAITGQVSRGLIGSDAFQEVDTYGMSIPITKHNFLVRSARELFRVVPEAFRIAVSGRPGPVLIDIPKDVQLEEVIFNSWPQPGEKPEPRGIDLRELKQAARMINSSLRPLLYIGGGIIQAGASPALFKLAHKNSIPVTSTLMGLGAFPGDDPLFLGMLGMHAARYTNMALKEADLLIAFGVRFDDRATGNPAKFCPQAAILHIDIDRAEINKIKKAHFSITADINLACKLMLPYIRRERRAPWLAQINGLKQKFPLRMPARADQMHPLRLIADVKGMADPDAIITTDVGQHQMWVAQGYCFSRPRSFLTSGGLGTMGFGLPAAIGAALAYPEKQVICFSGDGSLLMNIQELATLADLKPRLKVIVLNNSQLGLVRQQQELFYQGKYIASKFMTSPNFAEIAKNFGIPGIDLGSSRRPLALLRRALKEKGPCLINVPIGQAHNVLPMVAPGGANHEMIGGE